MNPRADVVGSLLRPRYLLDAKDRQAAEDRAVDEAVVLQESAGLDVVTDGEMRRRSFQAPLVDAVEGFGDVPLEAFLWGRWHTEDGVKDVPRPENIGVKARLVRRRPLVAHEFAYLRERAVRIPKVSLPSPGLWSNLWSPGVYPSPDAFFADIVSILRAEIEELVRRGARYIQLDAPHYTGLLEPRMREFYASRGCSLQGWIELDNAVMAGFDSVTFGVHL